MGIPLLSSSLSLLSSATLSSFPHFCPLPNAFSLPPPLLKHSTEDNGCAGVQLEEIVSFEVSVTLENCRLIDTPVEWANVSMKILFNLVSYVHTEVEITGREYVTFWPLSSLDRLASNSGTSISLHITSIQVCFTFTAAICAMHVLKYQTQHKWPAEREIGQDYLTWLTPRETGTVLPAYGRCSRATCTAKRHATCFMTSHALTHSLSLSLCPSILQCDSLCAWVWEHCPYHHPSVYMWLLSRRELGKRSHARVRGSGEESLVQSAFVCKVSEYIPHGGLWARKTGKGRGRGEGRGWGLETCCFRSKVKWFWALGQTGPNKLAKEERQGLAKYKSTITISSSLPIGTSK